MAGSNADFWELPFDPGDFDALPADLYEPAEASPARDAALAELRTIVATVLTEKQQGLVERYFFEGMTQAEIADEVGVSQQVVSRQLFGVIREGRRIGGAIARLRKACDAQGFDPEKWV